MKEKRALVLCGGGSLGAYEVGAWRYLRERKISFDIVTGTSIGALLGALVVSDDYEGALDIWQNITPEKVATNGVNMYSSVLETLQKATPEKFSALLFSYIRNRGADITPFKHVVSQTIDPKKVKNSPITFGVVTTEYPSRKEIDVVINDVKEEEIIPYLHASSACWPAFPICKIGNKKYIDGGYNNNLPINFALKLGAREIVAVMLPSIPKIPQHSELMDAPFVKTIRPTKDLGTILDFDHDRIMRNMQLGYLDAKKAYGECYGYNFAFKADKKLENNAHEFVYHILSNFTYDFKTLIKALKVKEYEPRDVIDIYIRALELLGEWLKLDDLKEYTLDSYLEDTKNSLDKLSKDTSIPLLSNKNEKHSYLLTKKERLPYLVHVYTSMRNAGKSKIANCYYKKSPEAIWLGELLKFYIKKDATK